MIFACSGPMAEYVIMENTLNSYVHWLSVLILLLSSIYLYCRKSIPKKTLIKIYGGFTILHPAWLMNARSGDCGFIKILLSVGISTFCISLLVIEFIRLYKKKE